MAVGSFKHGVLAGTRDLLAGREGGPLLGSYGRRVNDLFEGHPWQALAVAVFIGLGSGIAAALSTGTLSGTLFVGPGGGSVSAATAPPSP